MALGSGYSHLQHPGLFLEHGKDRGMLPGSEPAPQEKQTPPNGCALRLTPTDILRMDAGGWQLQGG